MKSIRSRTLAIAGFSLWLASCGRVPIYEPGQPIVAFQSGFESGTLANWHQEFAHEDSVTIVTNPVSQGLYAARFLLRPDDAIYNGHRSELAVYHVAPYGSEVCYRWSFYIPVDYSESAEWQVIGQWHDQPDYQKGEDWNNLNAIHSPPVQLSYKNQEVIVLTAAPDNVGRAIGRRSILKGVWHTVVYRIYWHRRNGRVTTWLNDMPLTPSNGSDPAYACSTAFNESGCYFKIGLYRSEKIKTTNVIYYDDVRIGNTLAEVSP